MRTTRRCKDYLCHCKYLCCSTFLDIKWYSHLSLTYNWNLYFLFFYQVWLVNLWMYKSTFSVLFTCILLIFCEYCVSCLKVIRNLPSWIISRYLQLPKQTTLTSIWNDDRTHKISHINISHATKRILLGIEHMEYLT